MWFSPKGGDNPGTPVEIVYDPATPGRAQTVDDLYKTSRFVALFAGIVWAGVLALCAYAVYDHKCPLTTTTRFISGFEVLQTPNELVIRGPRPGVGIWIIFCMFDGLFLSLVYQNIMGTDQIPPVWTRSGEEQMFVATALLVSGLLLAVLPVVVLVLAIRKRRRRWIFDCRRGELARPGQRWPLTDLREVEVEVVRGLWSSGRAAVVLHLGDAAVDAGTDAAQSTARRVELTRYYTGKGTGLEDCIGMATDLAEVVASFLKLPARYPPRSNQGFEVVSSAGS
jgi:hypothetical protein